MKALKLSHRWLKRLPVVIGIGLVLLLGIGVYWLQSQFEKPVQSKKQVQQITMIQPPPPPPPPPPEVKPPEPEPEPEPVPEPEKEPEPAPEPADEPPPGEELGVDADGGAGSDGFGLVGKRGGHGLLGGAAGSAILWYGGQVKRELEKDLQGLLAETAAGKTDYSVLVAVWMAADGRVSRAELLTPSGKADVDTALRQAIGRLKFSLPKAPPENMPQPIKIRVTSKL